VAKTAAAVAEVPVVPAQSTGPASAGGPVVDDGDGSAPPVRHRVTKVRKTVLANGSEAYGCAACSYTDATRDRVRTHFQRAHGDTVTPAPPAAAAPPRRLSITADAAAVTLAELMQLASSANQWAVLLEQMREQRDQYRDRALTAEAELRRMRVGMERLGFVVKTDDDDD